MIIVWFITTIIFFTCLALVTMNYLYSKGGKEALLTIRNGFKSGLKEAGFKFGPSKPKVKVYKWLPMHNACDEAMERATWEPMDIIDWMEEGLPQTPEMTEKCGQNCRCRLVETRRKPEVQSRN